MFRNRAFPLECIAARIYHCDVVILVAGESFPVSPVQGLVLHCFQSYRFDGDFEMTIGGENAA